MNIYIEVNYIGWECDILRKGNFPVNSWQFKEDPDWTVAEVTLKWINEIRRENNISKITKVTYNRDNDITDLVKELDSRIYDITLPF
ncbi:hypothetical protein [Bacillus benzoevorans]|uniref:hypothetical protein n=1 Tax=Bacillus benzoevorans TaxID=1456 RepID=UPI0016148BE9|nr:hypothetical protein [Bacillus benzoevorans]